MHIRVIRLRERGRLCPRWQIPRLTAIEAILIIDETRDEALNRFVRRARVLEAVTLQPDPIEPLLDAQVLWIKDCTMSIAGIESIDGTDYAQTWLIEVMSLPH